jgi:hypothetical protein
MTPGLSPAEQVRRINRTWLVHNNLDRDTEDYLAVLEKQHPDTFLELCTLALAAARKASSEQRDPKPDFYASLFREATPEERELYLKDHPWTRSLSEKLHSANGHSPTTS